MEHISCDVLVIGSGAAGLRAAIAAREAGRDVLVVSRAGIGKATCTGFSAGVMAGSHDAASLARHAANTLTAGRGINRPDLVEPLVREAPIRFRELLDWEIRAEFRDGSLFAKGAPPIMGEEIVRCLAGRNRKIGTRLEGGLPVTDLQMEDGTAAAVVYSPASAKWIGILAKSLVLASGGAAALYLRHDNPGLMLGDGYRLAFEAGAVLQDMEFVQFYPLCLAEPGLPPMVIPPKLADKGRLADSTGRDILEKHGIRERPAGEKARDRLSRALFRELRRSDDSVYLDLTLLPREAWTEDPFSASVARILGERYGAFYRPVRVAPAAHHTMGGIKVDPSGASTVPGLFAAGEVTGGLHGANRMGGNALSDALVFGARAGASAANWVQEHTPSHGRHIPVLLETLAGKWEGVPVPEKPLLSELRQIMWRDGGIIRDGEGLLRAGKSIRRIQEQASTGTSRTGKRNIQAVVSLFSALQVSRLIVEAARRRCESRGAHFRGDFPEQDDANWHGHLQVHAAPGGKDAWEFSAED